MLHDGVEIVLRGPDRPAAEIKVSRGLNGAADCNNAVVAGGRATTTAAGGGHAAGRREAQRPHVRKRQVDVVGAVEGIGDRNTIVESGGVARTGDMALQ